jgi:tetraacyldisaccharide-1-P 4'-kinase
LVRPDERPGWMDLLPAGPYRLTLSALRSVDCVLREGEDFKRTLVAHQNGLPNAPAWLLTGMGNPDHFHRALTHLGFRILGGSYGPDHGCPDLTRASDDARAAGAERFLCSLKDWIKLEKHPNRPQNLSCIREIVTLSTPFLGRATAFSRSPTS